MRGFSHSNKHAPFSITRSKLMGVHTGSASPSFWDNAASQPAAGRQLEASSVKLVPVHNTTCTWHATLAAPVAATAVVAECCMSLVKEAWPEYESSLPAQNRAAKPWPSEADNTACAACDSICSLACRGRGITFPISIWHTGSSQTVWCHVKYDTQQSNKGKQRCAGNCCQARMQDTTGLTAHGQS